MSIQLQGNSDSVFSNDVIAPNIPTQGQIVGYQQGEWTIDLLNGTGFDISNIVPVWSRVGQTVTVTGRIAFSATTNTNNVAVIGLPYLTMDGPTGGVLNGVFSGSAFCQNVNSSSTDLSGITCFIGGNNEIRFYKNTNNLSFAMYRYADFKENAGIIFTVTYLTDDTTFVPQNGATVS